MFPEGRIFDFLIIGVLALVVVGPKDLPILMRKVGRFLAHMRSMAAEFRASFDEMARQSELDELRREVEALRSGQTLQTAAGLGPGSHVHEVFGDIETGLRNDPLPAAETVGPPSGPQMTPLPPAPEAPVAPQTETQVAATASPAAHPASQPAAP